MSEFVSPYNDSVRAEQCHFCPTRHDLQTHHLVPQRKNGSDGKENLVIVCERCHEKLESLYDKRFYERLGLSDDKGEERSHFACTKSECRSDATVKIAFRDQPRWYCDGHGAELLYRRSDWNDSVCNYVGECYKHFERLVRGKELNKYREDCLNNQLLSVEVGWYNE